MKISCICRIRAKQHDKEIVLYAIEAPHPILEDELNKCASWVEHAYENGFFNENKSILVDHSYRDKFQMTGVYIPNGISKELREKYYLIIGRALQLSGLTGKELSKQEKDICLNYKPVVDISKRIDKWIIEDLCDPKNIGSTLDN